MYFSIIIAVLALLGLGVFGIDLLLFKLKRFLGYVAGSLASLTGFSPLVSFLNDKNSWFSQGGSGGVVGVAFVMVVAGAILFGSLVFWGYVIYRTNREKYKNCCSTFPPSAGRPFSPRYIGAYTKALTPGDRH